VPERLIVCGLLEALSAIEMDPVKLPVLAGLKVKLMVQDAFGAREKELVSGHGVVPLGGSAKGALGGVMLETVSEAVPVLLSVTLLGGVLVVPTA
jgi:hypothetical protein